MTPISLLLSLCLIHLCTSHLSPSTLSPTHLSYQSYTHPPTCLSMHPLSYPSTYPSPHPYSHPFILLIHQSIYVPSHLSLHLHSDPIIYLFSVIHPSIRLFINTTYLLICPHALPYVYTFVSIHLSIHASILIHLFIHIPLLSLRLLSHPLFIHLPFRPSIHLSVSLPTLPSLHLFFH